jgi:hypothetical protein
MGQGQSVSRGQTAEEKNGEILYIGLDIGWETYGDHWKLKPSLSSLQSRLT